MSYLQTTCQTCNDVVYYYPEHNRPNDRPILCDRCEAAQNPCVDCGKPVYKSMRELLKERICEDCDSLRHLCTKCQRPMKHYERTGYTYNEQLRRGEDVQLTMCRNCTMLENLWRLALEGSHPFDARTIHLFMHRRVPKKNVRVKTNCMFCGWRIDTPKYFKLTSYYKIHPNCLTYVVNMYKRTISMLPETIEVELNSLDPPVQIG